MMINTTYINNVKNYNILSNKFNDYHQNYINIFIHLITTPLSLLELVSITNKITGNTITIRLLSLLYCVSLAYFDIPLNVLALTSYAISNIVIISRYIKLKFVYNILIFITGYLMQDLSHYITNESTYQSSYINESSGNIKLFIEHTYYLLPLVITSSLHKNLIYKKDFLNKLLSILPLLLVYITDYIVEKNYIEYPWQVKRYKSIKKIDYSNLYYLTTLFAVSYLTDYKVFLLGTSYIHYIRYITTYYYRINIDYSNFKRDVLLYKCISMIQLYYLYFISFQDINDIYINIGGISLILFGNILSLYTSFLLGIDGCYFGIELGHLNKNKKYINTFPYGYIPHPMILSQCIAFYGINTNIAFYNEWPYLIYMHILLYITHLIQEQFDIHKNVYLPI